MKYFSYFFCCFNFAIFYSNFFPLFISQFLSTFFCVFAYFVLEPSGSRQFPLCVFLPCFAFAFIVGELEISNDWKHQCKTIHLLRFLASSNLEEPLFWIFFKKDFEINKER